MLTAAQVHKRQMVLLKNIAKLAQYRTDSFVSLPLIDPKLSSQLSDMKIVSSDGAACVIAYDVMHLISKGFLISTYRSSTHDASGQFVVAGSGVKLTPLGLSEIRHFETHWLAKAYEKQPMTFLTAVGGVLLGFLSFCVGQFLVPAIHAVWSSLSG